MSTIAQWFRRVPVSSALMAALLATPALAGDDFQLGEKKMQNANKAAAEVVKERMREERPEDARVLDQVDSADIVVVRGSYDRVEDVLRALDIRHTVVDPGQVARLKLNAKQLLIIDCPGNIGADGIERVRKFVNAGGYLYTTDWALLNVVQKAFPGFVEFNNHATANDVVEVQVNDTQSNLLKHLTLAKTSPTWWLEASSYPIHVVKPAAVNVLVTSREMAKKYGDAPIAVHFRYGDGQVLHIASHFYLQQNQTRGAAQAKKAQDFIKDDSTLSATTKAKVKEKMKTFEFSDTVLAGDLDSAYSTQQMTSNIVVDRKKDQGRVDGLYGKALKAPAPAKSSPTAPAGQAPKLDTGTRVKELERKGDQVKVRTMDGEEGWVPASAL